MKQGFTTAPGVSVSTTQSASEDAMMVGDNSPGITHSAGRASWAYTDANKRKHIISMLYSSWGGPPTAVQHYVDGDLIAVTANHWVKISGGWYRSLAVTQAVTKGTLVGSYNLTGTYTTTTVPCRPTPAKPCGPPSTVMNTHPHIGPLQKGFGYFALALAHACFPADAAAQGLFGPCTQQWLTYGAADVALTGASVALAAAWWSGVAEGAFALAMILAAKAEDSLLDCMLLNSSASSGGFGSGGGAAGGGGGGGGNPANDCLAGSYAAHCTTPFTL